MEITGGFPGEDAKTHYAVIGGDSQVLTFPALFKPPPRD